MGLAEDTLTAIREWASSRPDVKAVLLVGSQVRTEHPADQWSDIDAVLFVDDPDLYLGSSDWLDRLGSPLLTIVEPSALGGGMERRVLFRSGMDVDFSFIDAALAPHLVSMVDDPRVGRVLGRGIRVLLDKTEFIAAALDGRTFSVPPPDQPSQAAFEALSNAFWYQAVLAAKKLRRGETWVAKSSCDSTLKKSVIQMLAWKTQLSTPQVDTWHEGRFLEEWADQEHLDELRQAYAQYDPDDVARALRATAQMFERLEVECADLLQLRLPSRNELQQHLDSILRS